MEIPFYFCVLIVIFSILSQTITCKSTPGNTLGKTRILSEIRDIYRNKISTDQPFNTTNEEIGIRLSPMKGNLLEFHFSFTGTEGTSYDGGIYHGRILLHPDYPRKAPAISVLTPTGRWECGKDICLSATAHHQETWDPNWNLRTLVMALRGHILTQPREIGGILTSAEHQQKLAILSRSWNCPHCGIQHSHLVPGYQKSVTGSNIDGLDIMNDHSSTDTNFVHGRKTVFSLDTDSDGIFDTEKLIALAEVEGLREFKLITKRFRTKKILKQANRVKIKRQIFRTLIFSLFFSSALFFFQLWSFKKNVIFSISEF